METGVYSEEDKIRIIASFIPFVGTLVAHRYPRRETIIGKKVSSLAIFLLLTSIVFFSGATTTLTLLLTISYIGLIVVTSVQLFVFSRFLDFAFYSRIPTYLELDAHIKASVLAGINFFRVAFGGTITSHYQENYTRILAHNQLIQSPSLPYFAPLSIIALPVINLITLPSLWQSKYREYVPLILQGLLLTLVTLYIIVFYGSASQMGLYLLFPIIALLVESRDNILMRAPVTSIMVDLYPLLALGQKKMDTIKENEKSVIYTYEAESVIVKE